MKRIISVIALLIVTATIFAVAAIPVSSADGLVYKLFDPALDSQKHPVQVGENTVYGLRSYVNGEFGSISFCLPTWNRADSQCTIGIFKWQGNYDDTVAAGPLYEKRLPRMQDCANNRLYFAEPLPEGDYFMAMYDTVGVAGIWRYPPTKSKGFTYMDGSEENYDLEITVYFTGSPSEPVKEVRSVMEDIDGSKTVPPEYVIPDDDILNVRSAYPDTWSAIDGLGRTLPMNGETGDVRKNKYVAMFYWSWHNDNAGAEPFNVTEFMEKYPEAKNDYKFKEWPKSGTAYFWNEPVYGYYRTTDRWVIRKHAELLADAGVDVIFFDNTNGTFIWKSSYKVIFDVFEQARKDGVKAPAISFLLPFNETAPEVVIQLEMLYLDIYRNEKYQDLWFYKDGKPLILASSKKLGSSPLHKEIKKFFTFRPGQPAYDGSNGSIKKWGWLSIYPQDIYYATTSDFKNKKPEQMSVGVSQNSSPDVLCTAMNGENIFGRSYTHKDGFAHYAEENSSLYGYNFAEQWEYALEVDPDYIFVTGWNEWTAGRQELWGGVENAFADEFTDEYSRDIEPTKGKLKDHYYYQLVSYVRRFKGTNPVPAASDKVSIDIKGDISQWDNVGPYYVAYTGNTFDRNAKGYGSLVYTDETGRNDIKGAKMARDGENLYVMIECENDISPYTDPDWMLLYLDTTNDGLDGWESFDYVINKTPAGKDELTLERFTGSGYGTEAVGKCEYSVSGKYMQIKIKCALLGLDDGFTVDFKVTDGVVCNGDIMNFYTTGDVAPAGRFRFRYTAAPDGAGTVVTEAQTSAQPSTEAQKPADTEAPKEEPGKSDPTVIIIACSAAAVAVAAVVAVLMIKKKKK